MHFSYRFRQEFANQYCDLEQVTLKPQLQAHHCLTTWLQIWYHSLLWGDSIRKGADLEKQNCLFGVHPAELGDKLSSFFYSTVIYRDPPYHRVPQDSIYQSKWMYDYYFPPTKMGEENHDL